ncbi:hypothetical protein KQI58_01630 [Enterococcus raffinosus]|uniref:hypothetical protein n=1 Tax=Enterococcus raffinosus TaxID=71452 RepID=UPI001C119EC4|nr:hypothetical protein [Enterococcus raffinosus]MBU5359774.1 hypothetical protein [Enterococcus raffinosus]
MKKIFAVCLVTSFLLVGCNRGPSQESTKSSTSEASTAESSARSKDSSSLTHSTAASLSDSSSSQSFSSDTASSKQPEIDTVSADEFGGYATFYFSGMNVPDSININTNTNQITFNADTNSEAVYNFTMQDVPEKSIRVFSADTNEIRTVKVSTMLSIGVQISGVTNTNNQSGDLYLFHNKRGGLSLATPNYAGNVSSDQSDVMIEVLQ